MVEGAVAAKLKELEERIVELERGHGILAEIVQKIHVPEAVIGKPILEHVEGELAKE
jgi:hypothetical protein